MVSACGTTALARSGAAPADLLLAQPPRALVQRAQSYVRTGHYTFTVTGSQSSVAAGLTGFPSSYSPLLNASGRWTASGIVSGERRVSVQARFDGGAGDVSAVEVDCDGYGSVDGALWARGEVERSLARLLAPSIDDADVTGTDWHDLGSVVMGGEVLHHLSAALTPLSLQGSSAPAKTGPPPGLTLQPSSMDLWLRPNGSLAESAAHISLTMDFSKQRSAQYPDIAGTLHAVLSLDAKLQPSSVSVQAPLATLSNDPVPVAARLAFGPFSVQTDSCGTGVT
jgi:hypothetical protein